MHDAGQRYAQFAELKTRFARECGRNPEDIRLIAVSKTFPVAAIRAFYDLGQRDFGENYVREWSEKRLDLPSDIVWHIIGDLQSNKTREVAEHAAWVHSLSREKIARRLSEQRPQALPPLNVCVEVNVSGEPQKHGLRPDETADFMRAIRELPHLRLRGIMCVPSAAEECVVRAQMAEAQKLFRSLRPGFGLDVLSMGMSGDWRWAIAYGATHIRIGSALFGARVYADVAGEE